MSGKPNVRFVKCKDQNPKQPQNSEESGPRKRLDQVVKTGKRAVVPGARFGRLIAIKYVGRLLDKRYRWECVCDCGRRHYPETGSLVHKNVQSCGCLSADSTKRRFTTHGQTHSSTYASWESMKQRCCNVNHKHFHNYGGRGIRVCERWINSFEAFFEDMGERPYGLTLERRNNNLGYGPENCMWATRKVQQNNTRASVFLEFQNRRLTLPQWSEITGIPRSALRHRLDRKWSVERILTQPYQKR